MTRTYIQCLVTVRINRAQANSKEKNKSLLESIPLDV